MSEKVKELMRKSIDQFLSKKRKEGCFNDTFEGSAVWASKEKCIGFEALINPNIPDGELWLVRPSEDTDVNVKVVNGECKITIEFDVLYRAKVHKKTIEAAQEEGERFEQSDMEQRTQLMMSKLTNDLCETCLTRTDDRMPSLRKAKCAIGGQIICNEYVESKINGLKENR